jgi:hypothetical protein
VGVVVVVVLIAVVIDDHQRVQRNIAVKTEIIMMILPNMSRSGYTDTNGCELRTKSVTRSVSGIGRYYRSRVYW